MDQFAMEWVWATTGGSRMASNVVSIDGRSVTAGSITAV